MVSRKQHVLIMRGVLCAGAIAMLGILPQPAPAEDTGRKFYSDDPLWREPAARSVEKVAVRKVDDIYDFLENSLCDASPGGQRSEARTRAGARTSTRWARFRMGPGTPIGIGCGACRSPNSSAGRATRHRPTVRMPGKSSALRATASHQASSSKTQQENRYLLKLDPPRYPELCSAADVIGSKFFYALGYYTPENYVVRFRRENLAIRGRRDLARCRRQEASSDRPGGRRDVEAATQRAATAPIAHWRAAGSPGQVVGPFSYNGTRSDDPNDTIPHHDRRMLRGLAVFCAWLNHHDTRSINTMDTLVVGRRPPILETLPDGLRFDPGQRRRGPERALGGPRVHDRAQGGAPCRW